MQPAYYCLITLVLCATAVVGLAWRRIRAEATAMSAYSGEEQPELPQHPTDACLIPGCSPLAPSDTTATLAAPELLTLSERGQPD